MSKKVTHCCNSMQHKIAELLQMEAQERLINDFNHCTGKKELKEHMPFNFDDRETTDNGYLKTLCQDGYIIRYSTRRKTPLFTAERLDGTVKKKLK